MWNNVSVNGQTKRPRGGFKKRHAASDKAEHKRHEAKAASPEPEENLCLLRATDGKKKLSTVVSAKEVTRFQLVRPHCRHNNTTYCSLHLVFIYVVVVVVVQAYANLLKGNLDGLKKRDKKTAKAAAAKAKKSKQLLEE